MKLKKYINIYKFRRLGDFIGDHAVIISILILLGFGLILQYEEGYRNGYWDGYKEGLEDWSTHTIGILEENKYGKPITKTVYHQPIFFQDSNDSNKTPD